MALVGTCQFSENSIYYAENTGDCPMKPMTAPRRKAEKVRRRKCRFALAALAALPALPCAASAVVSEVCSDRVAVTICLLFRSCMQQTMLREYIWTATPVCENPNCHDARSSLLDPCDTICGCTAGITCPSC